MISIDRGLKKVGKTVNVICDTGSLLALYVTLRSWIIFNTPLRGIRPSTHKKGVEIF
jgi:hypothetical protein